MPLYPWVSAAPGIGTPDNTEAVTMSGVRRVGVGEWKHGAAACRAGEISLLAALFSFVPPLDRTCLEGLGSSLHRARDASRSKSSSKAVRGSRKAEGGKSAGTMDESVTGSVNPFLESRQGGR